MRNQKGQFAIGRRESKEEKEKRSKCIKEAWKKRNDFHGMYGTKFHNSWRSMMFRCRGQNKKSKKNYLDRGIIVCERWKKFKNFYIDMYPSYILGLQIDRIDNHGGYFPENCRWVTNKQNSNNRTNNIKIEYNGEIKTLSEWSDFYNINFTKLRCRYYQSYKIGKCDLNKLFRN